MGQEITTILANAGVLGAFFWWATQQLIPQLKHEREESLKTFRAEMVESRTLYREDIQRLVGANEKAVQGLLDHMRQDHITLGG